MPDDVVQEHQPEKEQVFSREVYVSELAGPDDYWLSITSAARVTRRQDITVRRWIKSGMLPVRGEPETGDQPGTPHPVGLNKRTRFVRASDVAKLTPIVDPSAVVIGEEGRLDLASIPAQQQQILNEYKQVTTQISEMGQQLEHSATALHTAFVEQHDASLNVLTQLQTTLASIGTQQHEAQETLLRSIEAAGTQQREYQGTLVQAIEAVKMHQEQQADHLDQQLSMQQETARTHQRELLNSLTSQQQRLEAAQSLLVMLTEQSAGQVVALDRYTQEVQTSLQRQTEALQALEQRLSHTTDDLIRQIKTLVDPLTGRLTTMIAGQEMYGQGAQKQMNMITRMLEEQAQTLSHLAEQQQHLQAFVQSQQTPQPSPSDQQQTRHRKK
jgi:hypothetical protein